MLRLSTWRSKQKMTVRHREINPEKMEALAAPFKDEKLNLQLLQEELAELIQITSKWVRFGPDATNREGETVRERFKTELCDVIAILTTLMCGSKTYELHEEEFEEKLTKKLEKLKKYYPLD